MKTAHAHARLHLPAFKENTMSKGKFSSPRPRREEDPEIRRAYRQMIGQESPQEPVVPSEPVSPSEELDLNALLSQENQETPSPASPPPAPSVPTEPQMPPKTLPEERPIHAQGEETEMVEDDLEEEDSFMDKALAFLEKSMDFCMENKKIVLVALCALALIVIVSVISVFFASTSDPYDRKILNNVYVAGVNVGGMTKKDAINIVKQSADARLSQTSMVVDLSGKELKISPVDASVKLDVKSAVNAAYSYGRTGTNAEKEQAYLLSQTGSYTVPLSPYMDINKRKIQEALDAFAADAGNALIQTQYGLEGTRPELSLDKFDNNAPGQTLVITMGTPGIKFDTASLLNQILEAYGRFEFRITANAEPTAQPDPLDLDAVYKEFYIAPVDAKVNIGTHETIPASYGYGFDLENAKTLVANAQYGETLRIPMEYIEPEIMDKELLYRDILGEYQTAYSNSESRVNNLRLACQALNGFVLDPGETFSFNDCLGKRTTEKGYQHAYVGTGIEEKSVLGGGISQVASTLYYCALLSDLQVTTRYNHDRPVSYIDYGLDADIQWNSRDLRFKNTTEYPVKLQAEAAGGYVTIQILGTEQRDYYVKLESRIQNTYEPDTEYEEYDFDNKEGYSDGDVIQKGEKGYLVRSFKLKYDRKTNQLISRDPLVDSKYDPIDEILAYVEPAPTTEPTTVPTEPETTEAPTTPSTAPSTEPPTQPTTEAPTDPPETTTASSEESLPENAAA